MTTEPASQTPFEVLIAGGGVAGLEAALALRDLAGARVALRLLSPSREFVYRPMTVREPFSFGRARRYPLREISQDIGAELLDDALARVDADGRRVETESGAGHRYDALFVALGARIHARYEHAVTLDDARLDERLRGLIQDVEGGYVKRLAFVIPARMAWPLPIYELALLTSRRAYDMNVELAITILTPEDAPLAVFGEGISSALADLLAENRIEVIVAAHAEIPRAGVIEVGGGDRRIEVDRVVALPELEGPRIPGLPATAEGFIPIDDHCRVRDTERVYAAGDATDFAVKQGGVAAQQADTAAQAIAALAGAPVQPEPFHPALQGVLLTGERPLYLSAHLGEGGVSSTLTHEPTSSPATKIAAKYLAPYLRERDRATGLM
jgi:sulfide:quinone oxidoreductase